MKEKPIITKASVKRICRVKSADSAGCYWMDRWIDDLVRGRSYPPQLRSDDFYSLLGRYFEGKVVLEVLEKVRADYRGAFPLCEPVVKVSEPFRETTDTLEWLLPLLKNDPNALKDLPPNYL